MSAEHIFQDAGRLQAQVKALVREATRCPNTVKAALCSVQEALAVTIQTAKAAADEEATRLALADYICQHHGLMSVQGKYVIGRNRMGEGVCLVWPGEQGEVSSRVLAEALQEADRLGCVRPIRIYGYWCRAAEVADRWIFCQLDPAWVSAALEERQAFVR